jgi:hypothetical protein
MLEFVHNVWKCLNPMLVAILFLVCLQHGQGDRVLLQQYNDLRAEHDELVSRLSNILPGGPYITEPEKEFDVESFTKEISSGLDLEE